MKEGTRRRTSWVKIIATCLVVMIVLQVADEESVHGVIGLIGILALGWLLIWRARIKRALRRRGKLPKDVIKDLREAAKRLGRDTVVFDLETTGLNPDKDVPVEIGAIRLRPDGTVTRFWTLVNPRPVPLSADATTIHGITPAMVRYGIPVRRAWEAFEIFAEGTERIVAYNADFDVAFMAASLLREGVPRINAETHCALRRARQAFRLPSYRLGNVVAHLGRKASGSQAHSALWDAAMAALVWAHLETLATPSGGRLRQEARDNGGKGVTARSRRQKISAPPGGDHDGQRPEPS